MSGRSSESQLAPGGAKAGYLVALAPLAAIYVGMSWYSDIPPYYVVAASVGCVAVLLCAGAFDGIDTGARWCGMAGNSLLGGRIARVPARGAALDVVVESDAPEAQANSAGSKNDLDAGSYDISTQSYFVGSMRKASLKRLK